MLSMKHLSLLFALSLPLFLGQCTHKPQQSDTGQPATESKASEEPKDTIVSQCDKYGMLTCTSTNGDTLHYSVVQTAVTQIRKGVKSDPHYFHHYSVTNVTQDTSDSVCFEYDRDGDGENWYSDCCRTKPYFIISPDKRSFFFCDMDAFQLKRLDNWLPVVPD